MNFIQFLKSFNQTGIAVELESTVRGLEKAYNLGNYAYHNQLCDKADRLNKLLDNPIPKIWTRIEAAERMMLERTRVNVRINTGEL